MITADEMREARKKNLERMQQSALKTIHKELGKAKGSSYTHVIVKINLRGDEMTSVVVSLEELGYACKYYQGYVTDGGTIIPATLDISW